MSSEMWAPEGYIRDMCAMYIHQQFEVPVSIEVSHNYFKAIWGLEPEEATELRNKLGSFKVDLTTQLTQIKNRQITPALVEFKLYTGNEAEADIRRLRILVEKAESKGKQIEGYLVISQQAFPHQKLTFVQDAFDCFSKKFKIAAKILFEIDETPTVDREGLRRPGRWPVGVCVIDVKDTS